MVGEIGQGWRYPTSKSQGTFSLLKCGYPRQINNQTQRYQDSVTVCVCGHWQQCHGLRRTCAG